MITPPRQARRYRFGVFDLDAVTGELRRRGLRVRLHAQPFQVLVLLLERPGEMLTREAISRALWPEGTFVDYEHGVNSAVNRLRDALGDQAKSPRFVETIARRGYRFVAPVERLEMDMAAETQHADMPLAMADRRAVAAAPLADASAVALPSAAVPGHAHSSFPAAVPAALLDRLLASPADLPRTSPAVVRSLFVMLQMMYLAFYIGALSNSAEVSDLLASLPHGSQWTDAVAVTAALLLPMRLFLICAPLFRAPGLHARFLRLWPFLLVTDLFWALAPFLLLHHIPFGLALACTTFLVYAPFAQRSLMLMLNADPAL